MSITTNLFVHDTKTISIKKCKAGEDGEGQAHDSWDIVIKDKEGHSVKVFCWGDGAELKINTTGEGE
jgi:hypothetical protein